MSGSKQLGKLTDLEFSYVLQIDPTLEEWRALAAEWFQLQTTSRETKRLSLDRFILAYIYNLDIDRNPYEFLRRDNHTPSYWESFNNRYTLKGKSQINNYIHHFLDWILESKLSSYHEGHRVVPSKHHNPVPLRKRRGQDQSETYKSALPYRYIRELRDMLAQGPHFSDWSWAHQVLDGGKRKADWFEVDAGVIDQSDPDCVWRTRVVNRKGEKAEITELWCPARAVALYLKLELPLRTFQIRVLDSGEADTWRYRNKEWCLSKSLLAVGSETRPYARGVFHKSVDPKTRQTMTGLYINTNKTADANKDELGKGYVIPWQHETALYWLEKLRDWQEKYNPLSEPVPWAELDSNIYGKAAPHTDVLEAMGTACFLFRNAAASKADHRRKPYHHNAFQRMWYCLLAELEKRCEARGEQLSDGSKIVFVDPDSPKVTLFPPHSLRVSLITAFALEGGVPFTILSKLIVGHARLIMTLYYTKVGKAHVSEVMQRAEKALLEHEQLSYRRFLKEVTYQRIEKSFVINDSVAASVVEQQISSAGFVFEDKGICPVGCGSCDIGGERIVNYGNARASYDPVPGYPEKNCVRCRFFITGPAFLPGLVAHFNNLSYQLSECANRYVDLERKVTELEDKQQACEEQDTPFTEAADFERFCRFYEAEAQKADKFANDLNATLRLIDRCKALLKQSDSKRVKLVPAGGVSDVHYALEEVESEMHQLETICEDAVLYPEIDVSKPTLRRSQILDAMLELNGKAPVFFKLSQEQQLLVGNHLMQLIQDRVGNLKGAVEVAEGKVMLEEIGLLDDVQILVKGDTDPPLTRPVPILDLASAEVVDVDQT